MIFVFSTQVGFESERLPSPFGEGLGVRRKLLLLLILIISAFAVVAQPVLVWQNRFDFESGEDAPLEMKLDPAGNIYITGTSDVDTFYQDILTVRINSDGNLAWHNILRNENDDYPNGLSVDTSGNVYVTGHLGNQLLDDKGFTMMYDQNGNLKWTDTAGILSHNNYLADDGHVYALYTNDDISIIKYDSNGNTVLQFSNDTLSTANSLTPTLLKVDQYLNVYVAGVYSPNGSNARIFLKKFSASGEILLDLKYDPSGEWEYPRFLEVDDSGYIYMAGWITVYDGILMVKFNTAGEVVWDDFIFDIQGVPYSLTLDADDNPVLCGKVAEVHDETEYVIIKYSYQGNRTWTDYLDSAGTGVHKIAHLAADASGNIYLATSTSPVSLANHSLLIIKYDENGNRIWEYHADSILDADDFITAMALDHQDNILLSIQSKGINGKDDILTLKFSQLTGIAESHTASNALKVVPNPFHSTATVTSSNVSLLNNESHIIVQDMYGRLISAAPFQNNYILDRSAIVNGVYFLRLVTEGNLMETAKIIIY